MDARYADLQRHAADDAGAGSKDEMDDEGGARAGVLGRGDLQADGGRPARGQLDRTRTRGSAFSGSSAAAGKRRAMRCG
jgi:hypothetical protein